MSRLRFSAIVAVAICSGCESKKVPSAEGVAVVASGSLAMRPIASQVEVADPTEERKIIRRPGMDDLLEVTSEIRSRIERRHPEAAGFLSGKELEEQLFAMDLKRGKDDEALKRLDAIAKGKWILLIGPITETKPEGFQLPVRYTPRDPQDPMGLTSQWLSIQLREIEGYDATEYRPGEKAAVLAKYRGALEASPGFDLVLLGQWYD
jgi:hypothetical protein